jgi:hypothetical protein
MNQKNNVELKENYTQVCVWPGTILGESGEEDFVNFMKEEFNTRVQFLEEITTKPDTGSDGTPKPGTGGRIDLFFAVHKDDIGHFAIPRLHARISWIEDVLSRDNYTSRIYPERVFDYCSWNHENLCLPEEG